MSDPLAEAVRELVSILRSLNTIVDTRLEARGRAAYISAASMNYGPPGAGEQSLTPRIVLSETVDRVFAGLGKVEGMIPVSFDAKRIAQVVKAIGACLRHYGLEHPRVETALVDELESRNQERQLRIAQPLDYAPSNPNAEISRSSRGESETWKTAVEAQEFAKKLGIQISLPTIGRHKDKFKWRTGDGKTQYEVELGSFVVWVVLWQDDKVGKPKKVDES